MPDQPLYRVQNQCGDALRDSSAASHHDVSKLESDHRAVAGRRGIHLETQCWPIPMFMTTVHHTIGGVNALVSSLEWVKQFQDTGCLCENKSPGRKETKPEVAERIRDSFLRSPSKSMRRVATERLPLTQRCGVFTEASPIQAVQTFDGPGFKTY
ncbi:hypothetical protein TNCV_4534631 [Trichonephila clavipes]|nr:hypothetical protein TNCV_4534631 [Trichonephila clavipes]